MPSANITADFLRNLRPPPSGQVIYRDKDLKGFGVRITASGSVSFVLHISRQGVERRMTLGSYGVLPVSTARAAAKDRLHRYELGLDIPGKRANQVATPRLSDLWEKYRDEYLPAKAQKTIADETSMWRTDILPSLGDITVDELSPEAVEHLHRDITNRGAPIRANRAHSSLRKALNQAIRWGWTDRNPANGLRKNPEQPRSRYASTDEINRLWEALAELNSKNAVDAISLLLLTGARKSEVLSARWEDIDLETGTWVKPASTTKQKRLHQVPLSPEAVEIFRRRHSQRDVAAPWVFSAATGGGHVIDIKKSWKQVCELAKLDNFRIHDLRHSFASQVISATGSLYVTGQLLGHTQAQTTARYAHLLDDVMRDATERASKKLTGQ
jgi:integrase